MSACPICGGDRAGLVKVVEFQGRRVRACRVCALAPWGFRALRHRVAVDAGRVTPIERLGYVGGVLA